MTAWTEELLIESGYKITNAKITFVDLSMKDHGCLTLSIGLKGGGWGCVYGGYALGHGYVGADEFDGSANGMESIMRIMDVVGADCFNDMTDMYIRVAEGKWGDPIKIIGNIVKDKWFDIESFYKDKEKEALV